MRKIDADRLLKMMSHWKPYMDMDKVREAIRKMPTLTPPNEWVSVEDRLPEGHAQVLMWSAKWNIAEAGSYYNKHFWVYSEIGDGYIADNITHWMYLPKPPTKET